MKKLLEKYKKYFASNPAMRKIVGIFLIGLGLLALVTPLTPGSWLALIGMEIIGFRSASVDRMKKWIYG